MTLHITYDHQCPKCQAFYIPYDDQVPCPKCGLIEEERIDYIEQAAGSMRFNKAKGSYTPAAWWVASLGDHILTILFPLFDARDEENPDDFRAFASERLRQMDWGDQLYLKEHVFGIAVRIHETLTDIEFVDYEFKDEKKAILDALARSGHDLSKAAEHLGISYRTLVRRMRKFNIKV